MNAKPRTLEQMINFGTSYEVVVISPNSKTRVAFTPCKTKSKLIDLAYKNTDLIVGETSKLGFDNPEFLDISKNKITFSGGVYIAFGNTERQVANGQSKIN